MGFLRSFLRFIRRLLSIVATILFCDMLLRVSFVIIFFMIIPFFIVHDHLVPALLMFTRSSRPTVDIIFGRLLPALIAFILSFLPPMGLYYFAKYIVVPGSMKLFELMW